MTLYSLMAGLEPNKYMGAGAVVFVRVFIFRMVIRAEQERAL